MKSKKHTALALAAAITLNAMSTQALAQFSNQIDPSLIDQSMQAQSAEMQRSLKQVNALIASMEKYKTASRDEKQNAFVNAARLMITILGLGSAAVHMKNRQAESSIELTLMAVSGVLSTALEKYVSSQRIDMDEVKQLLLKEQGVLSASMSGLSQEERELMSNAIAQIGQINEQLESKMNDIKRNIESGQTDVAVIAIATLVLNYAAPFLPKKIKDVVSDKAPTMLGHAAKTKKQSMQAMGATNVATLLSTIAGLGGQSSQAQMDKILSNLYIARANLMKQAGAK